MNQCLFLTNKVCHLNIIKIAQNSKINLALSKVQNSECFSFHLHFLKSKKRTQYYLETHSQHPQYYTISAYQTFKGLPLARMIIHGKEWTKDFLESRLSTACSFRIQSSPLCDFPFGVFDFPIKKVFFAVNDKAGYLSTGLLCDNKF